MEQLLIQGEEAKGSKQLKPLLDLPALTAPLSTSLAMISTSLLMVDISVHLAPLPPAKPIIVIDSSSTVTTPPSFDAISPTTSLPLVAMPTPIPASTVLEALSRHM